MVVGRRGNPVVSTVEEPRRDEVIIVRRAGNGDDEGHHGGVWKIAFADFMTAMMCFFLVMWLINAANEETKAAVASYFNPVKLIDRNASRKGLEDVGDGPESVGSQTEVPEESKSQSGNEGPASSGPESDKSSADTSDTKAFSDEHLFADPYAVLAEIAAETGELQNISAKGDGGAQDAGPATGASGGESYRDPFAPDFWQQNVQMPEQAPQSELAGAFAPVPQAEMTEDAGKEEAASPDATASEAEVANAGNEPATPDETGKKETTEDKLADASQPDAASEKAAETIRREIADALDGTAIEAGITVTPSREAVTISVTDELTDSMFEVGSAVPRRELVLAMEKIGAVLASRRGSITIAGHTDGRPFRSRDYDNWRLSTARAHSAYYMLVRAGLDELRIKEVAGFADRRLKLAEDPLAGVNRRIEIMLETGG
jgi:chemotaxis protein MotB